MKYIIGLLAMLLPILCGAQSPPVKPLNIGDRVPDITITNVYNYPTSTIRLSDLKSKLTILDFWSTWCASCIESFPKMHQLQKEFSDKVQVILVNTYKGDTIQRVKPFFDKRKARSGQQVTLPYSLLQSTLDAYFPHKFIPHYVWINSEGVVSAITSANEVTAVNIKAMLRGNVKLYQKKDILNYDFRKPLYAGGNGGQADTFLFRSILTPYIEGLGGRSGTVKDQEGKITMLYRFNSPAIGLIKNAFADNPNIIAGRIILETKDTAKFGYHAAQDTGWYKNSYCYQISLPPSTIQEVLSYMKDDMKRVFRISVANEKRKTRSLILLSGNIKKLKTKGGVQGFISQNKSEQFTNVPVEEIAIWLTQRLHIPVINETGIKENIDISFSSSFDFTNTALLIQYLTRKGFKVMETEKELEYAVICDLP